MKNVWLFACVLVLSLCVPDAAAQERKLVMLRDARIRDTADDKNSNVIGYALAGKEATVIGQRGRWYNIEYRGITGWVFSESVELVPERSAAEMIKQQDLSALGSVRPSEPEPDEPEERIKYARIRKSNVNIYSDLNPKAPILYTARGKNDVFVLMGKGTTWCQIFVDSVNSKFVDTLGWVLCEDIEIFDTRPTRSASVFEDAKHIFTWGGILGAVILLIVLIVAMSHARAEKLRNVYVQKNVLIIAKEQKMVQYTLTNAVGPIERCFSELGFSVNLVKDSIVARNNIEHNMPDLILIDWNFETAIFSKIDNLFSRLPPENTAKTHLLFFNVPDLSNTPKSKTLRNVSFLGITVSDREIFSVVTPLLKQDYNMSNMQKSGAQHCALEGEIDGGNLLEVLQFIEIGSRTGCLMIETKSPFGLIYFGDGRIIYAATKAKQGVDAVYAILNQPSGKFKFIANRQPKVANLNLPTLSVLMEWTKEKDEARRS